MIDFNLEMRLKDKALRIAGNVVHRITNQRTNTASDVGENERANQSSKPTGEFLLEINDLI